MSASFLPPSEMESAHILLGVFVYPWGYAVLDSDGFFEGLSIWLHGESEPCAFAVGTEEELLELLPKGE